MGYYIQTPQNLDKAEQIVHLFGGVIIPQPKSLDEVPADKALIAVVSNGAFDAAGLVYDQLEFREFTSPRDPRPKKYVLVDKALAHEMAGYPGNE